MDNETPEVNNADKSPDNWKSTLSTAFNEDEIFYSLLILSNFYVVYVVVKASFDAHDTSTDDEERFIQSCYCAFNQRFFYRFWFSLCCFLWFVVHTYNFVAQLSTKRIKWFKNFIKVLLAFCIVCTQRCLACCAVCVRKCICKKNPNENQSNQNAAINQNIRVNKYLVSQVKDNVNLLRFQYYKLYVIGYLNYDDERIQKNLNEIQTNENESTNDEPKKCDFHESSKQIIRGFLLLNIYILQLVAIPLLILQIFDTYSLVCFSPDSYCSNATEYHLNLLQAAITLLFYSSLGLTHFASTMLRWNLYLWSDANKKVRKSIPDYQHHQEVPIRNFVDEVRKTFEKFFDSKYPWTVYFLVDLRIVYIITFAFITTINLISSAANVHASDDKSRLKVIDVSSKYMDVNVTSINDAILWNCRRLSPTRDYYKALYWMVIIVMIVVMGGYFVIKLINLILINNVFRHKCCSCRGSTFKRGLTKLWHIAIHQKLLKNIADSNCDVGKYDELLDKDIPDRAAKELSHKKLYCFRPIIPCILLFVLVMIMCLAYLTFDLHLLACITEPEEELIIYKANRVELNFSYSLLIYQKVGAILVCILGILFVVLAGIFFYCTEAIINDLEKNHIQEVTCEDLDLIHSTRL